MNWEHQLWILLDIVIAAGLSGIIGLERESENKPAGLRTNMIIGSASCMFVDLGQLVVSNFLGDLPPGGVDYDPIRIIQAIIIGISFIGGGIIFKNREEGGVEYLTTSATILFTSGLGIAVALGQYILAVGLVLLVLMINKGVHKFTK